MLFSLWNLGISLNTQTPTIPELREYSFIQQNTLKPIYNIDIPLEIYTLGDFSGLDDINDLKELIREKYPDKSEVLICMWEKESSFGIKMVGDHGLAIGHFQIHLDKHPVSYDCAMDLECSANYTSQMIDKGFGYLWTSYKDCL